MGVRVRASAKVGLRVESHPKCVCPKTWASGWSVAILAASGREPMALESGGLRVRVGVGVGVRARARVRVRVRVDAEGFSEDLNRG